MSVQAAVLLGAILASFPQQPSRTVVIGTIQAISTTEIRVKAPAETVVFRVNAQTEVFKASAQDDLKVLRTGELVSVHGVTDASGPAVATAISARSVTLRAVVQKVNRAGGEMQVSPRNGSGTPVRAVRYYPFTVFGAGSNVLASGHEILIVGLESRDGSLDAARIAVYNTDLPLTRTR